MEPCFKFSILSYKNWTFYKLQNTDENFQDKILYDTNINYYNIENKLIVN